MEEDGHCLSSLIEEGDVAVVELDILMVVNSSAMVVVGVSNTLALESVVVSDTSGVAGDGGAVVNVTDDWEEGLFTFLAITQCKVESTDCPSAA